MAKSQANSNENQTKSNTAETHSTTIPQVTEKDEFCSPEFLDPNARLPRIQALRGTTSQTCGYFISVDQMANAGWMDFEDKQLITYTFESSGAEEKGILIQNPRMLVCPKSPVLGFDRKQSQEANSSTIILGKYTLEMKEDENIGNLQYFQVFLLDKNNQPLHQIPLTYKAMGANQASFATHWQEFCKELNTCHSIINGIPAKQKNALFYSLGIFCFKTAREQAGTKQKSFACKVVEHETPTLETWQNHFVGFKADVKNYVWESLEPNKPMAIPGLDNLNNLLLPGAVETVGISPANSSELDKLPY